MPKVLIVDGHSAIFAWLDFRRLHSESTSMARRKLISMLTRYQDASDTAVVLVYDGRGKKVDREGGTNGEILVMYSRAGETADSVIERLVAKKGNKIKMLVASNDRMVLDTVSVFGADCIGLKTLREMLDATDQQHRKDWGY